MSRAQDALDRVRFLHREVRKLRQNIKDQPKETADLERARTLLQLRMMDAHRALFLAEKYAMMLNSPGTPFHKIEIKD